MSVAARAVKRGDNLKARLDKCLAQLATIRAIAETEPHHECQLCDYISGKILAVLGDALDQPCEECGGNGFADSSVEDEYGYEHLPACPVCHGSGLRQIPGVERLSE